VNAVDVHDLLHKPGASRRWRRAEALANLATEMASVPDEKPVQIDVLFESVVEGILVSGTLSGQMSYRCARCLKDFAGGFDVRVRELFAHQPQEDGDDYPITEGVIDLEPMVRDTLVLSMPFAPLCKDDCLGLCSRCGGDRNLGECACGPEVDARWAALSSLQLDN
jgi:uncharacterized protein